MPELTGLARARRLDVAGRCLLREAVRRGRRESSRCWSRRTARHAPLELGPASCRPARTARSSASCALGQRSVTNASPESLAGADVLLTSGPTAYGSAADIACGAPGSGGRLDHPVRPHRPLRRPPRDRVHVQADAGAVAIRGTADRPPFQMGGRIVEWVGGAYAAVGAVARPAGSLAPASGDLLDLSLCEVANLTGTNFADLSATLAGRPPLTKPARTVELPSIEPTLRRLGRASTPTPASSSTRFCLLIERPDLLEGDWWARSRTRQERADEWNAIVREWTTAAHRPPKSSSGPRCCASRSRRSRTARRVLADRAGGRPRCLPARPDRHVHDAAAALDASTASPRRRRSRRRASGSTTAQSRPARSPAPGSRQRPRTAPARGREGPRPHRLVGRPVVHRPARRARRRRHPRRVRHAAWTACAWPAAMFVGREQWWEYSAFFLQAEHQQARRHARPRLGRGPRRSCCG